MTTKTFLSCLCAACCIFYAAAASAEGIDALSRSLRSPQELVQWLSENIKYEMTIPDRRRSADEVIDSGAGDCEGFAAVSKSVLERLGIASEIVVIEFDSLSIKHAVCVFRDGQNYSIISNQDLIRTDATNCEDAVKAVYPDWRRIIYVSTKMEYLRIVEH